MLIFFLLLYLIAVGYMFWGETDLQQIRKEEAATKWVPNICQVLAIKTSGKLFFISQNTNQGYRL